MVANYDATAGLGATVCNGLGDLVVLRSCPGGMQWVLAEEDSIQHRIVAAGADGVPLTSFSRAERLLIRQESDRLPVCLDGSTVRVRRRTTVRTALEAAAPRGACAFSLSQLYTNANAELQSMLASGQAFAIGSTVWASPAEHHSPQARSRWMSLLAKPGTQRAWSAVENKRGQVGNGVGQRGCGVSARD